MFSISSCNEKLDDNKIDSKENTTFVRSSPCGPPENMGCGQIEVEDYTYTNGDCEIVVNMTVTVCNQADEREFYFEDDGVPFSTNGDCEILEEEIELAYDAFIFEVMSIYTSESGVNCENGNFPSSIQIKNECTRLCEGPGKLGQTNYRWVSCSDEQGCCIETIKWCFLDGSFLIPTEQTNSDYTIGCIANSPNCNPTDDPFQEIVPCGGRCE